MSWAKLIKHAHDKRLIELDRHSDGRFFLVAISPDGTEEACPHFYPSLRDAERNMDQWATGAAPAAPRD